MILSFECVKNIIEFMNEFSVHKVEFVPEENKYLRIIIKKPFDYSKNHFTVLLEDYETGYYNGNSTLVEYKEFEKLDEFFKSSLYNKIKEYRIKNKIIGVDE